ncbi:Na+/H+ antiporter NhaA [Rudaeicoccus suwonensis]|uniref:Na(+)/H(+) antiporter NhaA n=1 Tax=Rudaeicoccus suwonensis TaxID=657409 RepID=A0A561E355_9MICO|nr:Na+/H+ antiporter NhaA [Rudaeicoccus suwonensis]TWE10011.1 sodium/proton antiporter (NhaA family) [Rudaeicoccus suwonensis]
MAPSAGSGLFTRGDWPEARRVAGLLRQETVGGALLLIASVAALVWANSPWRHAYTDLTSAHLGPHFLHLDLTVAQWSADGLLAVFFFLAGLELKHEFVHGTLREPAKAAVPVVAACCGVAVPALLYAGWQLLDDGRPVGWAIPTATDIAFALAVLAVIGTHLPSAMRSFLLTLAVVDDLIAITIIAFFYTDSVSLVWLVAAIVPLGVFGWLLRRGVRHWAILLPLAVVTWLCVLNSGVHATIAGVLLGMLIPVNARAGERSPFGERVDHRVRPLSAGFCVPVFAFCSAGVTVVGGGFREAIADPVAIGIIIGLVLGKAVGVFSGTFLVARFTRARLDDDLDWSDVAGLSLLAGIGFTVSLLIGELAFGAGSGLDDHVKLGVLLGSLVSALLATVVLRRRNATYRRIHEFESRDDDGDGVPDCYEQPAGATSAP